MPHEPVLILIADDERAIAALLCTIFEDEGYHVYACHSGKAAAKALEHLHPDLAILDMQMEQRWSGLEVVQHMRDNPTLSDIPVIIYSANNFRLGEVRDKLVAHHCQVLDKPFDLEVLLGMVAGVVTKKERQFGQQSEQ